MCIRDRVCKALTHMDMGDGYGDFRMMNRQMAEAILEMKEYNRYMKGIFSFVGFHTKWIPFENVERESGESKWNFKSLLGYAAEGILSFSTTPLKLSLIHIYSAKVGKNPCGWIEKRSCAGIFLFFRVLAGKSLKTLDFSGGGIMESVLRNS